MIKHQVCQKSSKAINKSFDDWRVFKLCSTTTPSSVGYFIEYFFVFEQCVCWLRKLSTHSIGIVFVYFVRPAEVVLKKCKKKPFSRELYGRCLSKILGIFASFLNSHVSQISMPPGGTVAPLATWWEKIV